MHKITHFLYCPLLGLGLYGGHRGNRWLKNRIKIFKQFVLPSLLAQTSKNFVLWVSVRQEDRNDSLVRGFREYLESIKEFRTVFTYSGVCFWDDKYPDKMAGERLIDAVHGSVGELINYTEDSDILMTIQPSDDCYHSKMVEDVQEIFRTQPDIQAVAYQKGYVMDYIIGALKEWNPKTNPPFFTIKFPKQTFIDPFLHVKYAGYKSHEYIGDFFKVLPIYDRGFLVGTHGENISTVFNHPFAGQEFSGETKDTILGSFGLRGVAPLELKSSLRKILMRKLPHGWQRKLRYWFGEKFYSKIYAWIRS